MTNDAGYSDEAAIVARARGGDGEAFRQLVEAHSREVFRLAYRLTGSRENAEDVVQESFLRAFRALPRFNSRSRFGTWLHRITANCAVDLLRRSERHEGHASDPDAAAECEALASAEPGPERLTLSAEIDRRVRSGLARLTPLERAAFVLRHFEEQSIADVGRTLGARTSATKQAVFRAVRKLRRELGPWMEESHVQPS